MDSAVLSPPLSSHQKTKRTQRRKRSTRPCLSCRFRKVRCDVSVRGQPCTNCHLDCKNCLVVGRASRLNQQVPRNETNWSPEDDYQEDDRQLSGHLEDDDVNENINANDAEAAPIDTEALDGHPELCFHTPSLDPGLLAFGDAFNDAAFFENRLGDSETETAEIYSMSSRYDDVRTIRETSSSEQESMYCHKMTASRISSAQPAAQRTNTSTTELFVHYPYLKIHNIHSIAQQDLNYMEAQGCLHVPSRPILDNFVEQYFRVHQAHLPLLNEGDFWEMYSQEESTGPQSTISLLVFQAMLFASCNFVSLQIIKKLGFPSLRAARAEFYRRTKLLYDLGSETSSLPLAQAAILMMGWVPPSNTTLNPYKTWLSLAIQHARSINADRYTEVPEMIEMTSTKQRKYQNSLHRLWWCCIIMDRISPLCTRYSLNITHDRFDFKNAVPLGAEHLQDDIYRSSVFTPAMKRRQISIFSKFLELVNLLTDVLTLMYPFEDSVRSKSQSAEAGDLAFEKCEAALEACTASIALCHSKILRQALTSDSVGGDTVRPGRSLKLQQSSFEVQDAAQKITACYKELTRRRLARWLPISALACLATPLTLHTVTARLSSLSNELSCNGSMEAPSAPASASNQDRLKALVDTMNAFFPQYYGVDWWELPDRLESDPEKPAKYVPKNDLDYRYLYQQGQAAGRVRLSSMAALLVGEEQRIKHQAVPTAIYS
ncbi:cutinase transcription factor 1 beta [Fusarium subglutinans]|uniref:Cutinase transcription factor 1 beta n=1 Tax=Gibberella subglutinans TaxID=42677 RepID=A0A8H5Q8M3_GIBSU|nr:cutinase transcription factor 1 beta [Fusarium subglutinans]KAF5611186.1 cutinase transcription factor 1 beta [Fusarium subglutinans]